jgi:hypothetical protein
VAGDYAEYAGWIQGAVAVPRSNCEGSRIPSGDLTDAEAALSLAGEQVQAIKRVRAWGQETGSCGGAASRG